MARAAAKKGKANPARKSTEEPTMSSQRETRRTRRSASIESVELAPASQPTRGSRTRATRSTSQDPAPKDPKNSLFNIPDPPDVTRRRHKRVASRASSAAPTVSEVDPDEEVAEEHEQEQEEEEIEPELKLEAVPDVTITEHAAITTTQDSASFTTIQEDTITTSTQFTSGSVTYPDITPHFIEAASSSAGFAQSVEDTVQDNMYNYDVHELSTVPEESPFDSELAEDALSQEQLDQQLLDQQVLGDAEGDADAIESYGSATSQASSLSHNLDTPKQDNRNRLFYNNAESEVVDLATDGDLDNEDDPEDDSDGNHYQPEESDQEDFISERPVASTGFRLDAGFEEESGDYEEDDDDDDEDEDSSAALFVGDGESPAEVVGEASEHDFDI
jgi:hypothetical protein